MSQGLQTSGNGGLMFDDEKEIYTENGITYGVLLPTLTAQVKHLTDPWLMFSGHTQALCDKRPLLYIDAWSRVIVELCQDCIARTKSIGVP